MIQKLSHTNLFVDDHAVALDFYVGKLGMEVRNDLTSPDGFRWVTVAPKGQAIEIVLMKLGPGPMMSAEDVEAIRGLRSRGALGAGVLRTDDCARDYEDLSAKGVEFIAPPKEQFYGVEALMKDPFGNWFSLTSAPRS